MLYDCIVPLMPKRQPIFAIVTLERIKERILSSLHMNGNQLCLWILVLFSVCSCAGCSCCACSLLLWFSLCMTSAAATAQCYISIILRVLRCTNFSPHWLQKPAVLDLVLRILCRRFVAHFGQLLIDLIQFIIFFH